MRIRWLPRPLLRLCFLVLGTAWSLAALPENSVKRRLHRSTPNPSASAGYLPVHLVPEDSNQMPSFRRFISRLPMDSTRHWNFKNGRLEITYDLMQDLASGNLPATGRGFGSRLEKTLREKHGFRFRSANRSYGAYQPNDEWYINSPQWGLRNPGTTIAERPGKAGVDINIEKVWDKFGGSDSLVIAVVDAGFDFHHPDLQGKNWVNLAEANGKPNIDDDLNGYVDDSLGWDFVSADNYPDDFHGHGTYCSSVIAANFDNAKGIAGVVPQCKIMPLRVLDASGHGDQDQIAKAILYAVNNGAKVINFSIGGEGDNAALRSAFQVARDKGVPVIVAAGNEGVDTDLSPSYPGAYPYANILVVAAHDHAGLLSSFSNFGKTTVDLAAPGELVLVAGIPDAKEVWKEDFEKADLANWQMTPSAFSLSTTDPIVEKQSLAWVSGSNVSIATANPIDLTGLEGGVLSFQALFHPVNLADVMIIEGNAVGSVVWQEIGIIGGEVKADQGLAFGLQLFDGKKFLLRFRTTSRLSSTARVLKLDAMSVRVHDSKPADEAIYRVIAGTSIAAPHVAAYVGLQRVACERMSMAWNRELALAGVATEPAFTSKVATGGRLDAYAGLKFYLSTLPDLHILDSTRLSWYVGESAQYTLALVPPPSPTYKFSVSGLGQNTMVDGVGKLDWVPGPNDTGMHTMTVMAVGPTVFRKRISLSVKEPVPVDLMPSSTPIDNTKPRLWTLGGAQFQIAQGWISGQNWVEVTGIDASGKVQLLKKCWLAPEAFNHPLNLGPIAFSVARLQVRLNGQLLKINN